MRAPPEAERRRMMYTWEELKQFVDHCGRCPLCRTRTHAVMGRGNLKATAMFVAEAPGRQEDQQGVPFVGRAGKLLDDMLELIDLDRTRVYITNICKCRPPENRDPLNVEQAACIGFLRRQVALVRPRIIVCLGRIAATQLIRSDFKISREHGQWTERAGVRMMAIYHPSALLRDPSRRPDAFDDLKRLQAEILAVCPEVYGGNG